MPINQWRMHRNSSVYCALCAARKYETHQHERSRLPFRCAANESCRQLYALLIGCFRVGVPCVDAHRSECWPHENRWPLSVQLMLRAWPPNNNATMAGREIARQRQQPRHYDRANKTESNYSIAEKNATLQPWRKTANTQRSTA